jgi:phosphonate transport system permease protein
MPIITSGDELGWRQRTSSQQLALWAGWLTVVALFVFCWQLMTKDTIWSFVLDAPRQAVDIGDRMIPPAFPYLWELIGPLWDTINIATLGTLIALLMAVPLAFLAARNTTPSVRIVRPIALLLIVASRSINSLVWGLLLVTIVGPGVLAGIIAIALRSIGFVAKLLYEAIEEIDQSQVDAVMATGASSLQMLDQAVVPQVMPAFAGISVYRWDINIRESTVLGLVGAGGLGLKLQASLNTLAWSQVTAILLVILTTVAVSELISARVRHAVI